MLSEIDVAFSRDQPEKVYVQHRMLAAARGTVCWLEDGAHLYVCGDEKAMAKDVHATLAAIVADAGPAPGRGSRGLPRRPKKQHRYQRDVY